MSASLSGRPTAAELVSAVADFLDSEVRDACSGSVGFHVRVAVNVLRTVQRELSDENAAPVRDALAELGFTDEAALAEAIRAGQMDERGDDVVAVLQLLVRHRLSVDHPGYAQDLTEALEGLVTA